MKVIFDGTPKEFHDTVVHLLFAKVTYRNGNQRVICNNKPMTDQQIEAEVLRGGWLDRRIECVEFSLDSGANPPFATIGR